MSRSWSAAVSGSFPHTPNDVQPAPSRSVRTDSRTWGSFRSCVRVQSTAVNNSNIWMGCRNKFRSTSSISGKPGWYSRTGRGRTRVWALTLRFHENRGRPVRHSIAIKTNSVVLRQTVAPLPVGCTYSAGGTVIPRDVAPYADRHDLQRRIGYDRVPGECDRAGQSAAARDLHTEHRDALRLRGLESIMELRLITGDIVEFGTSHEDCSATQKPRMEIGHRERRAIGGDENVRVFRNGACSGTSASWTCQWASCERAGASPGVVGVVGHGDANDLSALPGQPQGSGSAAGRFSMSRFFRCSCTAASLKDAASRRSMVIAPRGHSPMHAPRPSQ